MTGKRANALKTLALILLWAGATSAQTIQPGAAGETLPVYFHIESQGGEWNFERAVWENALAASGGADRVGYVHLKGTEGFQQAQAEARARGWTQPVISMTTANLPVRNSTEFARRTRAMDEGIRVQSEKFKGSQLLFSLPMCRLYQMPREGSDPDTLHFLAVIDRPDARAICYQSTITYFQTPPSEKGERPKPVYVDPLAILLQERLPPFALHSAYLAHKDKRDDQGRYLKRESAVYAVNEEIFLRAYFDNVRREAVGSPMQKFAIQLDLEIRDATGAVVSRRENHYVYANRSAQLYPVDETQFYNNITAGIALDQPGRYQVAFIFTDLNSPSSAPAEAVFDVTIE